MVFRCAAVGRRMELRGKYGVLTIDGTTVGEQWVRYHHLTPSYADWAAVAAHRRQMPRLAPQLIMDFTAYDTAGQWLQTRPWRRCLGAFWVGDLAVACTVDV